MPRRLAPDSPGHEQHDEDCDHAENNQIKAAKLREIGDQAPQRQHADHRTFNGADAADHNDENYVSRPIGDAEGGIGRNSRLLQINQRADHTGSECHHHPEKITDAAGAHADAARRKRVVAARRQRKAHP